MDKYLEALIEKCLEKIGSEKLKTEMKNLLAYEEDQDFLTIIANEGIHPNSPIHNRGEVYVASRGSLDFSSKEIVQQQFKEILTKTAIKLKSKPWKKVYLVPFGPAVLSMQIKLLVYRILYMETIDFLYVGHGNYYDLDIDLRTIVAKSGESESIL